jgi:hypothetical protein
MLAEVWSFAEVTWGIVSFFLFVMAGVLFVGAFRDLFFKRHDLSGWAKSAWLLLLILLPFLGSLIYLVFRPLLTQQDELAEAALNRSAPYSVSYSAAEEITKLGEMRSRGEITDAEFEKRRRAALR